jgi:N-acyl-D-aspartate/D-glutamate deacylase
MNDHFDLLIRNATIIDGTGTTRTTGDIALRGDRIAAIGKLDREGRHRDRRFGESRRAGVYRRSYPR